MHILLIEKHYLDSDAAGYNCFVASYLYFLPLISRPVAMQRLSPPTLLIKTWNLRLNLLSESSLLWRHGITT